MLTLLKPQYLVLFALLGCQPVGVPNDIPTHTQPSAMPTSVISATPVPIATPKSGPPDAPSPKPVAFDETFKIEQAQPMVFSDGLILNFSLKNDSRCPTNATCIWAGEVQTEFYFTLDGQQEPVPVTLKGGEEEASVSYKGYTLTLYAVDPYPVQQEGPVTPVQPVATVKVSTSATAATTNTP
jgi:hypothetical protein